MAQASVLKSDGTIATWGSNADGQLGNGRTIIVPTPGQLKELPEIVQVASSNEHVVALDVKGRVWTWGATNYGRLGSRAQRNPALPGRVQGIKDAVAVAATDYASFALKSDGTVWMWGGALYGWTTVSPEPRQLTQLAGIAQIAGGGDHLVMRTVNGTVVTLGANTQGQAGDGTMSSANGPRMPVDVAGLSNVTWVAAGPTSSLAVTATGQVFTWGQVQLEIAPNSTPQMVEGFARPVTPVAGRSLHFALLGDGTVWQFGWAVPGSGIRSGSREGRRACRHHGDRGSRVVRCCGVRKGQRRRAFRLLAQQLRGVRNGRRGRGAAGGHEGASWHGREDDGGRQVRCGGGDNGRQDVDVGT